MAGYEVEPDTHRLTFADMPGLEVETREPSMDDLLSMQELGAQMDDPKAARRLFRLFAGYLVTWNATRKGKPVPATYEGVLTLPPSFIQAIALGWMGQITEVDPTLPGGSGSGGSSPEPSLDLGAASSALPS